MFKFYVISCWLDNHDEPNIFKLAVLEIRATYLNYVVSDTNQI